MIAACPKCKTKYRIANDRMRPEGVRLRCTQCSAIFRVRAQVQASPPEPPEPSVDAQPTPIPRSLDRSRLILVALTNSDLSKVTVDAIESWGLQALTVFDGVEAMISIQRNLPRAVILDAALPKMFGFQICEFLKRNESLESTKVVLVGAIHHMGRYRRAPNDLYGADVYFESPDLPDGLRPTLAEFGFPISPPRGSSVAAEPPPNTGGTETLDLEDAWEPSPPPVPDSFTLEEDLALPPEPPELDPTAAVFTLGEEHALPTQGPAAAASTSAAPGEKTKSAAYASAERLARIIVSDVILYNQQKFDAAVKAGNVEEALDADLQEGRALFRSRIDPEVCSEKDFLREELLRVARERSTN